MKYKKKIDTVDALMIEIRLRMKDVDMDITNYFKDMVILSSGNIPFLSNYIKFRNTDSMTVVYNNDKRWISKKINKLSELMNDLSTKIQDNPDKEVTEFIAEYSKKLKELKEEMNFMNEYIGDDFTPRFIDDVTPIRPIRF